MKKLTFRTWMNIALVVAIIGVGAGATKAVAADKTTASTVRNATVQKGTVLSTVSATGNVLAANTSDLSFQTSGELTEVDVTAGQTVTQGQVLAKIDDSSQEASLQAAQLQLTSAQDKLSQAQAGATEQQKLQDQNTIQQAQDKVTSAQDALDAANSGTSSSSDNAGTSGSSSSGSSGSSSQSITQLQASLTSAQESLANTKAQIAASEKPDPSSVASAQASVITAQSQVTQAQKAVAQTTLTAPFTGTITAVNKKVGDTTGSGSSSSSSSSGSSAGGTSTGSTSSSSSSSSAFATLTDLSSLEVKAGFTESDISKLKIGQTVNLTYDALTGETETGSIVSIDSTSTTVSNVVTYYVYATINSPSASVKPGMTATAQVVVNSRDNVLYLSNTAITGDNGTSTTGAVQKLVNGKQVTTTVGIGLKGDDSTEITSGLSAGDQVAIVTTTSSSTSGTARLGSAGAVGLTGASGFGAAGGGFAGAGR